MDAYLGITATFRKYFADNPGVEAKSDVLKVIKKGLDEQPDAVDPRDYLKPVSRELLREPPNSELAEVMALVKDRIADHVEFLVHKFGSAGLAGKVAT